MFNQSNITTALTNLIEIKDYKNSDEKVKISFSDLSMPDVCMSIINHVQTVYEYEIDADNLPCFRYRGKDLFNQRACKLFEELISTTTSKSTINQFWELWLLEDMTFAVVEDINTIMPHRKNDKYSIDYRTVKTIIKNIDDIPFNIFEILEELEEMSYDILENETIIYAM